MKAASIVFSSFILAGLLLVTVESRRPYPTLRRNSKPVEATTESNVETATDTTVATHCGINMYAQECFPCNQVCNGPASSCALTCGSENNQCKCNEGHYLPTYNSTYCVLYDDCPSAS